MAQQALHTNPPTSSDRFDWLGTIRGVIVAPSATFGRLADMQPWRQGLAFYLVSAVGSGLINAIGASRRASTMTSPNLSRLTELTSSPVFRICSALIVSPLVLLFVSGMLYQIGLRQGGDGPYGRIFSTEVFKSATTGLVGLPLTLLAQFAPRNPTTGLSPAELAVSAGIGIWGLVLTVYSVRASMRLSTGSAVGVVAGAIVAAIFLFAMAFCVLATLLRAL